MLVASRDRFLPTVINTLVLSKNDYFYYIHRDVYDQAVILADKYTKESLMSIIEPQHNLSAIHYFYEQAPYPIHILAVFLGIVDSGLSEDMEVLTGALHVITAATNIKSYVEVNKELRKTLQFSLYIQEEYEMAWERFFITSIPYDERHTAPVQEVLPVEAPAHSEPTMDYYNPQDNVPSEKDIENMLKETKALEKEKLKNILYVEES
ncbi:hypothetical protein HZI73_23665 [Vallitalea pronyensis]|uniref:Uncharacterized protein n=1 Tax=Vallitalea pronyensis TaxID=1348613 RepID=A0A8J8SJ46_9FIRM|nr:hypothetical protein [Vallitalea pronyensis]QUI25109.1 hypothetical protein HZI73_23665 [Vallitalea pronyensis]